MNRKLIWIAIALTGCGGPTSQPVQTDVQALVGSPERYSGKRIEVAGVLAMGFEAMIFEDPVIDKDTGIWFGYADFPLSEKEERGFEKLMRAFAETDGTNERKLVRLVRVRVIGTFQHARPQHSGFGHLGGSRSLLVIERVLAATPCEIQPNKSADRMPGSNAPGESNRP